MPSRPPFEALSIVRFDSDLAAGSAPPASRALLVGRGRAVWHMLRSFFLAGFVALLATRLGTPSVDRSAKTTPSMAPASELRGTAAVDFCRLLLDEAARRLHAAPAAQAATSTLGDAPRTGDSMIAEQFSPARFDRWLQGDPRRALEDVGADVSLTQHVVYRGRTCYRFCIVPRETGHQQMTLLFDELTGQPLGGQLYDASNASIDGEFRLVHEWLATSSVAERSSANVVR